MLLVWNSFTKKRFITKSSKYISVLFRAHTSRPYTNTNSSVKEPSKFHNYETEKITRKASDAAEYIQLFGSSARDRHARRI